MIRGGGLIPRVMCAARTLFGAFVASLLVGASAHSLRAQAAANGGNGTIIAGTYGGDILIINESDFTVRHKMRFSYGVPTSITFSNDNKRIYVASITGEHVEVFDLETRKQIDHFSLSTRLMHVEIQGMNIDPLERYAIFSIKRWKKLPDRYEFFPNRSVRFDLKTKTVTDTIKWPGEQGESGWVSIRFSPDGKLLYFFAQDEVIIYDAVTFRLIDRWDYQRANDDGMGRIPLSFGWREDPFEEPGYSTNLVTFTDPIQNRSIMALGRTNLNARTIEVTPIGPTGSVWFSLSPDRKRAYGIRQEQIGEYEFWTLDIDKKIIINQARFAGRPRMALMVSSNGKQLYIYGAGGTFDVYDAETYKHIKQVEMEGDMLGVTMLPPPRTGGR
jgi:WD40 repeat protein